MNHLKTCNQCWPRNRSPGKTQYCPRRHLPLLLKLENSLAIGAASPAEASARDLERNGNLLLYIYRDAIYLPGVAPYVPCIRARAVTDSGVYGRLREFDILMVHRAFMISIERFAGPI